MRDDDGWSGKRLCKLAGEPTCLGDVKLAGLLRATRVRGNSSRAHAIFISKRIRVSSAPGMEEDDIERQYSSPACLMHEFEHDVLTIYHNPRCSKSRQTLELIHAAAVEPRVVEYLKTPPSVAELTAIVKQLGIAPAQLVRKGEPVYNEKYAGKQLTNAQWIEAMVADPILIERPIVVGGGKVVLGRPPENVKALLP